MKLLSILISLVMMLSGGYGTEDPNAAASSIVTIRDAIVTLDGAEYPLNPSITLGAASENGSALLDVGMTLGEDILFPVQVKLSDAGIGLVLGESGTVYTLTPAFIDELTGGEELPGEANEMLESFGQLMTAMGNLDPASAAEQQKAAGEKFLELIGDASGEEASFTANGEEQTGKRVDFTLTSDQVVEYMDFCFEQMPEGYADAYFGYLNATMRMADLPELNGFGDILSISGMELTIDGHVTYNETSGVADLTYHTSIDPEAAGIGSELSDSELSDAVEVTPAEPVSLDIPMSITVHTPEDIEYSVDMDLDGAQVIMNGAYTDGAQTVSAEFNIADEGFMTMDVSMLSGQTSVLVNMDVDGVGFDLSINNTATDAGSTTECAVSFADEVFSLGAQFAMDVTHDPIADRTLDATVAEIDSSEDLESNAGLGLAAMSLMSGAEKLMNDESILALVEAVQAYTAVEDEYTVETVEETAEIAENPEATEEAAQSTLPTPIFSVLPEGYELTESDQSSENYASFYFEYAIDDGEYHSTLYVDMESSGYDYGYDTYSYTVTEEGVQRMDDPVVTIHRYEDGSFYADYVLNESITLHLSYYDADMSDEDIVRILTGITLP